MAVVGPGQIVSSKQGRDAGTVYCVLEVLDNGNVVVADGRSRSFARPKVKNRKHLVVHTAFDPDVRAALQSGSPVSDQSLRKAVAMYHGNGREEGSEGHGKR